MYPKKYKNKLEKIEVNFNTPSKVQVSNFISPKKNTEVEESLKKINKTHKNEKKNKYLSNYKNLNSNPNQSSNQSCSLINNNNNYNENESYKGFKNMVDRFSEKINNFEEIDAFTTKFNFNKNVDINVKLYNIKPFELSHEKIDKEKKLLQNLGLISKNVYNNITNSYDNKFNK
jgi:hypothetical protein